MSRDGSTTKAGYFVMARGWMDHPALQEPKATSLSRREAWIWLIEKAAYRTTRHNISGKTLLIARGQYCASYRMLADEWGWSIGKAQDVLGRWVRDGLISMSAHTGKNVLTICNYSQYQMGEHTEQHTPGIRQAYGEESQKKESNQRKELRGGEEDAREADARDAAAYRQLLADAEFEAEVKALEAQLNPFISPAAPGGAVIEGEAEPAPSNTVVSFPTRFAAPAPAPAPVPQPAAKPGKYSPAAHAIVSAFDEARDAAFGKALSRGWPNATDHLMAQGWIEAAAPHGFDGEDVAALAAVAFREKFSKRADAGEDAPNVLKFFDRTMRALIAAHAKGSRSIVVAQAEPEVINARRASYGGGSSPVTAATLLRRETAVAED